MADKLPLIQESDLKANCYRLNRNFELVQEQIAASPATQSAGGAALYAQGTGSAISLTNSYQDAPGAVLTLPAGTWAIWGLIAFILSGAGDIGFTVSGALNVAGVDSPTGQSAVMRVLVPAVADIIIAPQQWLYTSKTDGVKVKLRAKKSAGTGTSQFGGTNTTLLALQIAQ